MVKKILVIDDDPGNLDVITLVLSEFNYEIVSSLSLTIVKEIPTIKPDLILLDYWLCGTSGAELCKALKADQLTSNIIIILISAVMGLESIALKCCADGFISKPFDIDYLAQEVSIALLKS